MDGLQNDLKGHSEREILMNMLPRLENVERNVDRQDQRQDKLDDAISALRRDLIDTEERLSKRVDDRFDKVDKHLSEQDTHITHQSQRMDQLVSVRRPWPQGAIIFTTASGALIGGILIQAFAHLLRV